MNSDTLREARDQMRSAKDAMKTAADRLDSAAFALAESAFYEAFFRLDRAIDAALAAAAPAAQPEPVAWYLPADGEDDSMFRDHRTVVACNGSAWTGWQPLYAHPPTPQAELAEQFEALDVSNHRLRRGMQALMARLADLLDEDQFAECESISKAAGVAPQKAPQAEPATVRLRPQADTVSDALRGVLSRICVYAGMAPEVSEPDNETWESWYTAAFGMLSADVRRAIEEAESIKAQAAPVQAPSAPLCIAEAMLDAGEYPDIAAKSATPAFDTGITE